MRSSSILLLLIVSACSSGVAPGSGQQSSGGSLLGSGDSTSGSPGSSGSTGGSDTTDTSTGGANTTHCTPGNYVFCRCDDRSEGTKLCRKDGLSFDACTCAKPAPVCDYPPSNNPPGCPTTYSHTYQGQPCPSLNLTCSYPGAGDQTSGGCNATAMMWCRDAGDGLAWTTAQ